MCTFQNDMTLVYKDCVSLFLRVLVTKSVLLTTLKTRKANLSKDKSIRSCAFTVFLPPERLFRCLTTSKIGQNGKTTQTEYFGVMKTLLLLECLTHKRGQKGCNVTF